MAVTEPTLSVVIDFLQDITTKMTNRLHLLTSLSNTDLAIVCVMAVIRPSVYVALSFFKFEHDKIKIIALDNVKILIQRSTEERKRILNNLSEERSLDELKLYHSRIQC